MEKNEPKRSHFKTTFHSNRKLFRIHLCHPLPFDKQWLRNFSLCYKEIQNTLIPAFKPQLDTFMRSHYPELGSITHPVVCKFMDSINEQGITDLVYLMKRLLNFYDEKVNIRRRASELISVWEYYKDFPDSPLIDDAHRAFRQPMTDEEWEKEKQEINRKRVIYFEWLERRQSEYCNFVRPVLHTYLPQLNEIDNDYRTFFEICLVKNYEVWRYHCGNILLTIDFEMPLESLGWPQPDWDKMVRDRFPAYYKIAEEKDNARIYGK